MKSEQRFPPIYKAKRFAVAEGAGFVRVSLDPNATAPSFTEATMALSGTSLVGIGHAQYGAALYDDPGLVLDIRGVSFTSYLMSELHEEDGKLAMERSCQWKGLRWPAPFSPDFPITLLTRSEPITGETDLTLRDADFNTLLSATIAPVPAARGVTAVRWRCQIGRTLHGLHAKQLRMGQSFRVRDTIDAAALRVLKPSASRHGEDLRASITGASATAV